VPRIAKFANLPAIFHCPSVADGAIKLCVWQRGYRPLWGQDVITPEIPMVQRLNITLKMCKKWVWHLNVLGNTQSIHIRIILFPENFAAIVCVKPCQTQFSDTTKYDIANDCNHILHNSCKRPMEHLVLLVPFPSCPVLAPPQLPVTKWLGNFWPSACGWLGISRDQCHEGPPKKIQVTVTS